MCLIAWNWQPASATPLLLLANRDEFYARPAERLHWWAGGNILAGKDLQAGGTWMGLTRTGRLAALTNYRNFAGATIPQALNASAPSRGELVTEFLNSQLPAHEFLQQLSRRAGHYSAFNLLVFDGNHLLGLQSRDAKVVAMQPGFGAVSNADFHSPWPKLTWLRNQLETHVGRSETGSDGSGDAHPEALLSILENESIAPDDALPQTGLPLARERALSAAFIRSPDYGTRACSVIQITRRQARFTERSFDAAGLVSTQNHAFALHPPSLQQISAAAGAVPVPP